MKQDRLPLIEHHERAMEYHLGKMEETLDSDGFLLVNVISYLYHQGMASYHTMLKPSITIRGQH